MALRHLMAALAALLPLYGLASDDLKPVDFENFQCGEDTLDYVIGRVMFREIPKTFEHWWPDGDRSQYIGSPDADGWRRFEDPFQETVMGPHKSRVGKVALKPWRRWDLIGRVRQWEGGCELDGLAYRRAWVDDVTEHVLDKCFRYYYVSTTGDTREKDVERAVRVMQVSKGNRDWMVRTVESVRDSPLMADNPSGSRLSMAYGHYVLQCESEIEAGDLEFVMADMEEIRRVARGE